MDAQAGTLIGFTLQQGVAVAVCVGVAVTFAYAVVKLFNTAKEERKDAVLALKEERAATALAVKEANDACRKERETDRAEWMAVMNTHSANIQRLADRLDGKLA